MPGHIAPSIVSRAGGYRTRRLASRTWKASARGVTVGGRSRHRDFLGIRIIRGWALRTGRLFLASLQTAPDVEGTIVHDWLRLHRIGGRKGTTRCVYMRLTNLFGYC